MNIKFLKAFYGDSILLQFKDSAEKPRIILIDGGIGSTYRINRDRRGRSVDGELKVVIDKIKQSGQVIDLLVITHVDEDHIEGILKWFKDDVDAFKYVREVWFNSGSIIADYLEQEKNKELEHFIDLSRSTLTSIKQGIEFSQYLSEKGILRHGIIKQGDSVERFGLSFQILSPNKPKLEKLLKEWKKKDPDLKTSAKREHDYAISLNDHIANDEFDQDESFPNGSSIAFILNYGEKKFLFLGDSHPSVIVEGLSGLGYSTQKPIEVDLVKISHHGSSGNTNYELLDLIRSEDFVISSNGDSYQHPDKQLLARLINKFPNCRIHFNYKERMDMIFSEQDRADFPEFETLAITNDLTF